MCGGDKRYRRTYEEDTKKTEKPSQPPSLLIEFVVAGEESFELLLRLPVLLLPLLLFRLRLGGAGWRGLGAAERAVSVGGMRVGAAGRGVGASGEGSLLRRDGAREEADAVERGKSFCRPAAVDEKRRRRTSSFRLFSVLTVPTSILSSP